MFEVYFAVLLSLITFAYCDPQVKLSFGTVRGFTEKVENEQELNVFLGVPYAEPPTGPKRFQKPHPLKKRFDKVIEAKRLPNMCMQPGLGQFSEDCLYLNIWSPAHLNSKVVSLKSVMVFFPGGGFIADGISNKMYNASKLSAIGDVVVVTVNYRLGPFGFLFGGNEDIGGNMGLYDQLLSLQWINENINRFGGDNNSITIFGESAGAVSVSLHLLSPFSQPLFKNAIIMSGVAFRVIDNAETALEKAVTLSRLVGCGENTHSIKSLSNATIDCLRKVEAFKLTFAQLSPSVLDGKRNAFMLPFFPLLDKFSFPVSPKKAWSNGHFRNGTNLLIGNVPNDGIAAFFSASRYIKNNNSFFEVAREYFSHYMNLGDIPIASDILELYFTNRTKSNNQRSEKEFYQALSDILFTCPSIKLAQAFSKWNNVYQYVFDYHGAKGSGPLACKAFGPCHGDELAFTFGTTQNKSANKISFRWIKIISEFAKTGAAPWPKYHRTDSSFSLPFYFHFTADDDETGIELGYRFYYCYFWNKFIYDRLTGI